MGNNRAIEPLVRDEDKRAKHTVLIVAAGAFCLGAVFLAATLILAACSASVSSAIKADGSARISIEAEIPTVIAAKFRKLANAGGSSQSSVQLSIFDVEAIRKSLIARPGVDVVELSQPKPDSIHLVLAVRNLKDLAASPDFESSGILGIERGQASTECRFRLEHGKAKALTALFSGIDPNLMDALSPPALEEDPLSIAEYETMLKSVFGEKAMPAMEAAAIKLSITAPGKVLSSGGGSLSGSTLTATIPVLEILVLEKPVEVWLRWKNAE
jgi:hypothetical protein